MSLTAIGWLFTLGVLAHNTEEAVSLPAWSLHAGRWYKPVGSCEFRWAVCVFSALPILLTAAASRTAAHGLWAYLMAGFVLAMVLNVFVPHVLVTLLSNRCVPGTLTGLVINLPLGLWYLSRAFSEGRVAPHVFVWAGPAVALGVLALLPVLFLLGRKLCPAPA